MIRSDEQEKGDCLPRQKRIQLLSLRSLQRRIARFEPHSAIPQDHAKNLKPFSAASFRTVRACGTPRHSQGSSGAASFLGSSTIPTFPLCSDALLSPRNSAATLDERSASNSASSFGNWGPTSRSSSESDLPTRWAQVVKRLAKIQCEFPLTWVSFQLNHSFWMDPRWAALPGSKIQPDQRPEPCGPTTLQDSKRAGWYLCDFEQSPQNYCVVADPSLVKWVLQRIRIMIMCL